MGLPKEDWLLSFCPKIAPTTVVEVKQLPYVPVDLERPRCAQCQQRFIIENRSQITVARPKQEDGQKNNPDIVRLEETDEGEGFCYNDAVYSVDGSLYHSGCLPQPKPQSQQQQQHSQQPPPQQSPVQQPIIPPTPADYKPHSPNYDPRD